MDETSQRNNQFLDFQSPHKHSFDPFVTGLFLLGIVSSRFAHVRAWVRILFLFKLKKIFFTMYFCIVPLGLSRCLSGKESACNAGHPGLIPGLGRPPGGGHGYPFQY